MDIFSSNQEKIEACKKFMAELETLLQSSHYVVGSCNKDISSYLIPNGSIEKLSYYGKPEKSFRFSDHWNWYSNLKKCSDPKMIQCHNIDLPWPFRRIRKGGASKPREHICVAYYGKDKKYHTVYGEKKDEHGLCWIETDPIEIAKELRLL